MASRPNDSASLCFVFTDLLVKYVSHVARTFALGLWHEEEHEEGGHQAHTRVHEVGARRVDGILNVDLELGHQEGAQPVEGRGEGRGKTLGLQGEELAVHHPRQWTVANGKEELVDDQ